MSNREIAREARLPTVQVTHNVDERPGYIAAAAFTRRITRGSLLFLSRLPRQYPPGRRERPLSVTGVSCVRCVVSPYVGRFALETPRFHSKRLRIALHYQLRLRSALPISPKVEEDIMSNFTRVSECRRNILTISAPNISRYFEFAFKRSEPDSFTSM